MAELTLPAPRHLPHALELQAVLFTGVLLLTLFLVLFPIAMLIFYSFSVGPPAGPLRLGLDAWENALASPMILGSLLNTIKLLLAIHLISFPVAVTLAWLIARTDLPGAHTFELMFWVSFFMPTLAVLLGWIMCLDPEYGVFNLLAAALPFVQKGPFNIYSFWGIVWAHLVSHAVTVKVMLLTPTFRNLDTTLEEAAWTSGASRLVTFLRIVLPVTLPALIAILLLAMIRAMQSFEIELVLGPPFRFYVYSTLVYSFIGQEPPDFGSASALATMGLALIVPLIALQRWVALRRSYATVSGRMRSERVRLGPWRIPALIAVLVVVTALTILPLVFLGLASIMKLFGFFDVPQPWTLDHWRTVLTDEAFRGALVNTLRMSSGASILAVTLLSLIAYFAVRSRYRARGLLDLVSWLPYSVPGILFGLGLLYVFLELPLFRPFYGTIWLMILATVVAHMTFGTQVLKSNLLQLSRELEEAARMSGASWLRTLTGVVLPILFPSLILVAITSFITSARDVASVALVATAGTKTLSLVQLDFMIQGRYGPAAVISLVVVLMSTGLAALARLFGLRIGLRS
jgi:iron(III) transport system permease protein